MNPTPRQAARLFLSILMCLGMHAQASETAKVLSFDGSTFDVQKVNTSASGGVSSIVYATKAPSSLVQEVNVSLKSGTSPGALKGTYEQVLRMTAIKPVEVVKGTDPKYKDDVALVALVVKPGSGSSFGVILLRFTALVDGRVRMIHIESTLKYSGLFKGTKAFDTRRSSWLEQLLAMDPDTSEPKP